MNYLRLILILLFIYSGHILSQLADFEYLDPLPGADLINRETGIIISPGTKIEFKSLNNQSAFSIYGSISGICKFQIVKSEGNNTIILKPQNKFAPGEEVTVKFNPSIKKTSGGPIKSCSYFFYVRTKDSDKELSRKISLEDFSPNIEPGNLPPAFPYPNVTYSHFPSSGKMFLANLVADKHTPNTPYLMILNSDGSIFYTREMPGPCYDFKEQPNGNLTYFDSDREKYFMLNENYSVRDSFFCGNGYNTDLHELRLLQNGNAYLMSYDTRFIDSNGGGGTFNVTKATGLIIQEIDAYKNVIFQWRSWDHFKLTDATHENFSAGTLDYCHGNAIEIDNDGNIIISSRNMDEITKINRLNGQIIWRLGGKNNQFTFVNDPIGFSHQHAIRRIKNGNITLFDNGNFHVPPFSRAVEYKLDEINKTATLVWQYRHTPSLYAAFTGYVQRLDNNNTLIGWGYESVAVDEVRPDGTKVFELKLPDGMFSYRAFKYEWKEVTNDKILPSQFGLRQNYPNPFNPVTTIKFEIPLSQDPLTHVKIVLVDILGRNLGTILEDDFNSGTFSFSYDGSRLATGVYFYSLTAGGYRETKKMMLVK